MFNQLAVSRDLAACAVPLVQDFAPQILHAHSSSLNGLAGITLARRFKLPLVYELRAFWEDAAVDHGTTTEGSARYRATRMLETHVLRKADAVTTICHGIRQDLIGRGIPPEKITVIPNAVDVDAFDHTSKPDTATADRLGITGKTVLGFIGSFYAYEGLDLLIAALPKILANVNDACLLLVGGGYQDAALRAQVQQLGLTDKVIFTGRVPHEQVSTYYDLIDVLVYPRHSMRLTETVTPLKPLEAMAQGRLLIASDVGGHKELIEDGVTGSLFRAGDADDLAATACDLLSDRSNWPARISAGRHFVEQNATGRRVSGIMRRFTGACLRTLRKTAARLSAWHRSHAILEHFEPRSCFCERQLRFGKIHLILTVTQCFFGLALRFQRGGFIDVVGAQRGIGQHGHLERLDFENAAGDKKETVRRRRSARAPRRGSARSATARDAARCRVRP